MKNCLLWSKLVQKSGTFRHQLCFSDIKYHLAFWNAKTHCKNGTKTRNSADSEGENICKAFIGKVT
jgi:hypothetical protein